LDSGDQSAVAIGVRGYDEYVVAEDAQRQLHLHIGDNYT